MSKDFSLQQLSDYIADNSDKISRVRREVEEIQVGFNSAYVEWKAQHDATLEQLGEAVTARLEAVGADGLTETRLSGSTNRSLFTALAEVSAEALGEVLRTRVEERADEERALIAERRQELREKLIPEAQAQADRTLQEGQRLSDKLRKLNPRLDRREEELKAQRAALEEELAQFNEQIHRLSGCLGVVLNFFKISRLDRQRQQAIGQLKVIQQELKKVREEWQEVQHQTQAEQETLQGQWQELILKLAQLQGELDHLDEEANRQALALRRAVRYVIDNLKEPIACPADDIKHELDAMVKLNIQTDDYQEGLGSVGSFMSVLDGIIEGLKRFNESVQGLINEQRMHSSYLPKLHISVPDRVLLFSEQWDNLARKVRDDRHLCANPAEFVAAVRPVMEEDLSEANVKAMFEGLGRALKRSTRRWRG